MPLSTVRPRHLKHLALSLGVAALAVTVVAPVAGAAQAKTKRVAINGGGKQANETSWEPSTSADGRYVAFETKAGNLVKGDSNGESDVFVRDRKTKKTKRVSVRSNGAQAIGGDSFDPSISASGRYVAFDSAATNLVRSDTNGNRDVFVHDRRTRKTKRVSVRNNGAQAIGGDSRNASISADGRYVAFQSDATNLVGEDSNGRWDIFVHDRKTKRTRRVNVKSTGGQAIGADSRGASISANGRYVAFRSDADNLVKDDTNAVFDVFVHDRQTKKTRRVSVRTDGGQAIGSGSSEASISANGRFVAFASSAGNLVSGDTNATGDVFVHDRWKKKTKRISLSSAGAQGDKGSFDTSISANGRWVAFSSDSDALHRKDTNGETDVFVHDRKTKKTRLVSVKTGGGQGADGSEAPSISADGRFVSFESAAKLVPNDSNDWEVYVRGPLR